MWLPTTEAEMTEHQEQLVRLWRKEGVQFEMVCMILTLAELTGRDISEVGGMIVKHANDIKKTLYGT